MSNRYEIEEGTHAIRVYYDGADVAGLFQPYWPNGTAWASAEEAAEWAEMFIESMEVEDAPFAPGGPGEERTPKPTPEEIAAMQAQMEARRNGELPQ
jgi:hypothetical protein